MNFQRKRKKSVLMVVFEERERDLYFYLVFVVGVRVRETFVNKRNFSAHDLDMCHSSVFYTDTNIKDLLQPCTKQILTLYFNKLVTRI